MPRPTSESARIADQLRRAFDGAAWHGPALLELLKDIDAVAAAAKPIPTIHSIWELVLHIAAWDTACLRRLSGEKLQLIGEQNFPRVPKPTQADWRKAVAHTRRSHDALVKTVAALPDSCLRDYVPGKRYDFWNMMHGVVQHELYHAGQIAILQKVQAHARARHATN